MFNSDIRERLIDVSNKIFFESASSITGFIVENDIEVAETIFSYNKLMSDTLNKNGNIYNNDVKVIMDESSKDVLSKLVEGLKSTIALLGNFCKDISIRYANILAGNKIVIEKYQPLLKQLNVSKFSYTMPEYSFTKLANKEMIMKFCNYFDTIESTVFSSDPSMVINKVQEQLCNPNEMISDIKRAILGAPKIMKVDDNFHDLVSKTICDPSVKSAKYFSDDIFNILTQEIPLICDIDLLQQILLKELQTISGYLDSIMLRSSSSGDPYFDSVLAKKYTLRKMIVCIATGLIAEIIQEKFRLLSERDENYRKIIVAAYDNTINTEPIQESYIPMEDSIIGLLHDECKITTFVLY